MSILPERFWSKIDRREDDDCWPWLAGINSVGYGVFKAGGSMRLVHRLAYEALVAPIPQGMLIDHRCRNRWCVNVRHLRLATRKQNGENLGLNRNNTSGYRGARFHKQSGLWHARVRHNGKNVSCGYYKTAEEAGVAAATKRAELYTHSIECEVQR